MKKRKKVNKFELGFLVFQFNGFSGELIGFYNDLSNLFGQ